jgi:hypothetical protein
VPSDRQCLQGLDVAAGREAVDVILPSIVLRIYMLRGINLVTQIEMFYVDEQESNVYSSISSTTKQSKVQQEGLCHRTGRKKQCSDFLTSDSCVFLIPEGA